MTSRSEHSLLLTHLERWAAEHNRPVDLDLLEQLLDLRSTYDGVLATSWPSGSVTDLLLRLWPAKGQGPGPDPDTVAESFDTFVRFLRNTGRMAGGSADPKDLSREARRAAPKMAGASANRSQWSPGKVLGEHAQKLGLDLDGAQSLDDLDARMAVVNTSWNSLPIHERQRLMPNPGDQLRSGRLRAMDAYGTNDPVVALVTSMRYEWPKEPLPDPSVSAPYARDSGLLRDVRRMLEELPDRIPVTSTGLLKPAMARQLHARLDLSAWEDSSREVTGYVYGNPQWRSARDLLSLQRLWTTATTLRWIDVRSSVAYVDRPPTDLSDDAALKFGVFASIAITLDLMDRRGDACGLMYVLLRSYVLGCEQVSWDEVGAFLKSWEDSANTLQRLHAAGVGRRDNAVRRARNEAFTLADAGVFESDDKGLKLTPLGDVFVTGLIKQLGRS